MAGPKFFFFFFFFLEEPNLGDLRGWEINKRE